MAVTVAALLLAGLLLSVLPSGQPHRVTQSPATRPARGRVASTAPAYGMGGYDCFVTDSAGRLHFCGYNGGLWDSLRRGLGIRYVRILVPWNTLATWDSSTDQCVPDDPAPAVQAELADFLQAASDDGLTPLVAIATVDGAHGTTESLGGLSAAPTGPGHPSAGDDEYSCGFAAIVHELHGYGQSHAAIEVWNEPDSSNLTAAQAAEIYLDAYARDRGLGDSDRLIAGAFNYGTLAGAALHPHANYMATYLSQLTQDLASEGWPAPFAISGHPYNDVTVAGAEDADDVDASTRALSDAVAATFGENEPIWLTEAGDWLADPNPDPVDPAVSAGTANSGNGRDQAWAAEDFLHLGSVRGVTAVFWYQFETYGDGSSPSSDAFDSALVGLDGPDESNESGLQDPSQGEFAVPRPSYCLLAHDATAPASEAVSAAVAACGAPTAAQLDPFENWESFRLAKPPANWKLPAIATAGAGSPSVGATLSVVGVSDPNATPSVTPGGWVAQSSQAAAAAAANGRPQTSLSFAYQWERCSGTSCSPIRGATAATYSVSAADVGATIAVAVTATDAVGSASATSEPVGPVLAATSATGGR